MTKGSRTRKRTGKKRRTGSTDSGGSDGGVDRSRSDAAPSSVDASPSGVDGAGVEPGPDHLSFERFTGLSRLVNWFYSSDEERILAHERQIGENLGEFERLIREHPSYLGARNSPDLARLAEIERELGALRARPVRAADYARVTARLDELRRRLDELSVKQAVLLGLDASFAKGSPQTLPEPKALLAEIEQLAFEGSLRDLGRLRYLVDALSQWSSDAILRTPAKDVGQVLHYKARVAEAAAALNEAFFRGLVTRDYDGTRGALARATGLLKRLHLPLLLGAEGASPKAREDFKTAFDSGAMGLAASLADSGLRPALVVGLPTGGAHAANKLAGALAVRQGRAPALWYTRPQAVKESSKAIFTGVEPKQLLHAEEIDYLRGRLAESGGDSIVIIDDGAVSGKTLELARALYQEHFPKLRIVTATIKGGSAVESDVLPSGADNTIDFVVNQTDDRVGPRAVMKTKEPLRSEAKLFGREVDVSNEITLATLIDVHSAQGTVRTIPLGETLAG